MRNNTNFKLRERMIVKVSRTPDPAMYRAHAAGAAGIQYRKKRNVRAPIREVVDQRGFAFAFAYTDRNGRWHFEDLAPDQTW